MHNRGTVWPSSQWRHVSQTKGGKFGAGRCLWKEPGAIMPRPYVGWVLWSPNVFVCTARGSHVFVCRVFCCDTAIMDECWQPVEWPQTEGLVLVVLTLAPHNNVPLVKQVSSWQNHYCPGMVIRPGREWEIDLEEAGPGPSEAGGVGGGLGVEGGIRFVLSHHWALKSFLKLPQYKLAGPKKGSGRRGGKNRWQAWRFKSNIQ